MTASLAKQVSLQLPLSDVPCGAIGSCSYHAGLAKVFTRVTDAGHRRLISGNRRLCFASALKHRIWFRRSNKHIGTGFTRASSPQHKQGISAC